MGVIIMREMVADEPDWWGRGACGGGHGVEDGPQHPTVEVVKSSAIVEDDEIVGIGSSSRSASRPRADRAVNLTPGVTGVAADGVW